MIFSVTHYLELRDVIVVYYTSHILPTKVELGPRLDHIFIRLGPGLLHCPVFLPHLCGTSSSLGTNVTKRIQVDIAFIIPKLIDGVPSHAKRA